MSGILKSVPCTPAEFISNPNQTHLSMLIRVVKIIRQSQVRLIRDGALIGPPEKDLRNTGV